MNLIKKKSGKIRILIDSKLHNFCFSNSIEHAEKPKSDAKSKPIQKSNVRASVPTLQSLIDCSFKQQLQNFKTTGKQLEVDDVVLTQMSGYCPWPGKIEGFTKDKKRIRCYFYGSHNRGTVDVARTILFVDASELVRLINLKKKIGPMRDFVKGVRELEIEKHIPESLSSLRELDPIEWM